MSYGKGDSGDKNPDHIHQKRDGTAAINNLFSERKEGHGCKFKALDAIGDSDDRNTPETSGEHPT